MDRRSYHSTRTTSNRKESTNDGDKRRSTWHPSPALASRRQTFNEGKPLELPTSTSELLENSRSYELPIQSTQEFTSIQPVDDFITSHQIDSSLYTPTPPSMVNSLNSQNKTIQSTRQSLKSFHQVDPSIKLLRQSVAIRSTQQSALHEPVVDVTNSKNAQLTHRGAWKDNNAPIQPQYASIKQANTNQSLQHSSMQNYESDAKVFEGFRHPYEHKSYHQPTIENHFYRNDRQSFQNRLSNRSINQFVENPSLHHSMVDHSLEQSFNSPSSRQSIKKDFIQKSMAGKSTLQATIQSNDNDNQAFDSNNELPYQLQQSRVNPLAQELMAHHRTQQTIPNKPRGSFSNSPSSRQSTTYKLKQPSMIIDEDLKIMNYEIWPEEVQRQQPSLGQTRQSVPSQSTRQSMLDQSVQQSGLSKSTRPSTVHGYNMDNQMQNDTNQLNEMLTKSTRQSIATKSMRPSTAEDRNSHGKLLKSDNEILPNKSIRQSSMNIKTPQSKAINPSNNLETFESNDASFISRPYASNRQSATSMSTQQFTTNPAIQHSMVTQPNCQSMANRSLRQSTGNQSTRPSMALKLDNQSVVKEYDPKRHFLYTEEALLDPLSYQSNQQSMVNCSPQHVSNRHVQQTGIGNSESRTNGFENDFILSQSPSKLTQQSKMNQSARNSQRNKLIQRSTNMKFMRPSINDHKNTNIHMFDNEIPQNQQSIINQSMQHFIEGLTDEPQIFDDENYSKVRSFGDTLSQQSHENSSNRPSTILKSLHQMSTEDPNIELQTPENDIQSTQQSTTNQHIRQSLGDRSIRQSMKIKSICPSMIDHQTINIQRFEDEVPQSQQFAANSLNQKSMANQLVQQTPATNIDVKAQISNDEMYPNQISIEEKLYQQPANRYVQHSTGIRSAQQSTIANPNLDYYISNDGPQWIQQSMANRSTRQSQDNRSSQESQGNKSNHQSIGGRLIRQSTIDNPNIELQIMGDDVQLNQSPYISSRQSMANRSHQLSTEDISTQHSNSDKFIRASTSEAVILEPNYFNNENLFKKRSFRFVPQSIENMSYHHPIDETFDYQKEMLEGEAHLIDPLYKSLHQSINEAQASNRSSFHDDLQNQSNEEEFSKLTSYSGDHFEPEINIEESRTEATQNTLIPSRFVTLEVRSNVQKESLDKFLVGGWDSVTLKIPPEMHSLLHGIRNSLASNDLDLDLEKDMANMAEGNDGQCSANIRILYSGIYNSNQEPTNSELYEQSHISHINNGSNSSNCLNCNTEREQSTVRFNIER